MEIINTERFSFNESIYFLTQTANDSDKLSPKEKNVFTGFVIFKIYKKDCIMRLHSFIYHTIQHILATSVFLSLQWWILHDTDHSSDTYRYNYVWTVTTKRLKYMTVKDFLSLEGSDIINYILYAKPVKAIETESREHEITILHVCLESCVRGSKHAPFISRIFYFQVSRLGKNCRLARPCDRSITFQWLQTKWNKFSKFAFLSLTAVKFWTDIDTPRYFSLYKNWNHSLSFTCIYACMCFTYM